MLTLAVLVVGLDGRCLRQGFLQAKSTAFEVAGEEALLGSWGHRGLLYHLKAMIIIMNHDYE